MSLIDQGSTANRIVHKRTGVIDITGVRQLSLVFKVIPRTLSSTTSYLVSTYDDPTDFNDQLSVAMSAPQSILFRAKTTGTGGGTTSLSQAYNVDDVQSCVLTIDLDTQLMHAYINGVALAGSPAGIGTDLVLPESFDFKIISPGNDNDISEPVESAYWIGHVLSAIDVTAYEAGTDLDDLSVAPDEVYRLNGTEGDFAPTLAAQNSAANDLIQISGAVIAPDWPEWGAPSILPPPSVPVGYNRYSTDIATANTVSAFSFFVGIAVEDGMLVDVVDSVTVLLEGGLATGFVLTAPITTTIYFYYPSTGDYIGEEFIGLGDGGFFRRGSLGLGIGPGLTFLGGLLSTAGQLGSYGEEYTEEFS